VKRRRGNYRQRPVEAPDPEVVARVERLFDRLDHLASGDTQAPLPAVDQARRAEAREAATDAAIRTGRGRLLQESRRAAREVALRRFGSRVFRPTWVGLNWGQSMGTVEDRVAMAEVFDDAAIGAVITDIEPDLAADLLSGLEALESIAGGAAEQSFELALRRRPFVTRAYALWFVFGLIATALGALGDLGPVGLLIGTTIVVLVVLAAVRNLAPRPPLDQRHRDGG
jgi:hypothetical protein